MLRAQRLEASFTDRCRLLFVVCRLSFVVCWCRRRQSTIGLGGDKNSQLGPHIFGDRKGIGNWKRFNAIAGSLHECDYCYRYRPNSNRIQISVSPLVNIKLDSTRLRSNCYYLIPQKPIKIY